MQPELKVFGINGPVVTVRGKTGLAMTEMVYVGKNRLIGEVISVSADAATIQVYENTTGLFPGEPVESTGSPMTVELGPGLLRGIYDGIARPLDKIEQVSGAFIGSGINIDSLDPEKVWDCQLLVQDGDEVSEGQVFAETQETTVIRHRALVPPGLSGRIQHCRKNGSYTVKEVLAELVDASGTVHPLTLAQRWAIRKPRPTADRLPVSAPLVTGQRVIDTLFPIAKGGTAAIPGGFGTGKTMLQHQLAKWSDADIIVYVGCGERGNEMTQVLQEFSELKDPKTGSSMLERTILIANTSNMPVAAREASIYTGVTIAEYYRDMGYHVALMADSTSRWAEALREISGRLEEMPAEEGFPAYLPSRLSAFYERAGMFRALCGRDGSVTIIGAVSPQSGDFSEPVTMNTKRFIRCFWALEKSLAYSRHYPAVNWNTSYSEYHNELAPWFRERFGSEFSASRVRIQQILQEENSLMDIVKLIGSDLLADDQKLVLETARVIRVAFLQQNAMNENDAYVPVEKQYYLMRVILSLYDACREIIAKQIPVSKIRESGVFDRVIKSKYEIPNNDLSRFKDLWEEIRASLNEILALYR